MAKAILSAALAIALGSTAGATTLSGSDLEISFTQGIATSPAISLATANTNGLFLSAWGQQTPSGQVPYGQMFDQAGQVIGSAIAISGGLGGSDNTRPRIGYSPLQNTFLVVWTDGRNMSTSNLDIYGQLISSEGKLIGNNFVISNAPNAQQRPGIAYDSIDDRFLVVWGDARSGAGDIYGQLVSSTGNLIGANFAICNAEGIQDRARAAFDPIKLQYLVVWSDDRNKATTGYDIYGQKVGPGGTLIGASIVISNAPADQFRPDITWDGNDDEFMVVFQDCRDAGPTLCVSGIKTNADIYGQVVASGGVLVGDNFPVATDATNSEYRPSVSFSATSDLFEVAFSHQSTTSNTGEGQIWGAELTPDGTLVGANAPVTPTPAGSIQERAGITWNPNYNGWLAVFVNQANGTSPQQIWGQYLAP